MPPEISYTPPPDDPLRLVEIDVDNYLAILQLEVADGQNKLVASNAVSLVQGHYHDTAWFRAVYEGERAIGFVMLYDPRRDPKSEPEERADLFVWRLMIARERQGEGLGRRVIGILREIARSNGFSRLCLSFVEGERGPGPFYEACGFVRSGRIIDGEIEACIDLETLDP